MSRFHLADISHSIHARLTFLVMMTVFVVFSVVTIIISRYASQTVLEGSELNAMNRMEIANQRINSLLVAVEVAVHNTSTEVVNMLDTPDKMYEVVQSMLEKNPYIIGSAVAFEPYFYPEKGRHFSPYAYERVDSTIGIKQLGTEEYDYHYMDWYQIPKLLKKDYWSEPYYDSGGGEQMMTTYSLPLFDKQGKMYAIFTADVSLNWLTELVKQNDLELNSAFQRKEKDPQQVVVDENFFSTHIYSFIIGRGGAYITHPATERILNETYFTYCDMTKDSEDLQTGYNMVDGKEGMSSFYRDGINYTICYAPIEHTGWSMATVMPSKAVLAQAHKTVALIILMMLSGLIALYFVTSIAMKRITRPLVRFAISTDEITKGNLDATLPEIHTNDEMKHLQQSFQTMLTSLKNQMEELRVTTASKTAIESELKVASDIQMSMLPKIFPPYPERDDIDIYGQLTPAKAVGGDLFYFFIRDEKLFFCIGDVSGKGVPAALVMAVTRAQFRTVSMHESLPNRIMMQLNETMCEGNESNMFVTFFIGILDLPSGRLRYCNAGHDAPVIIGNGKYEMLPCDANLPIGVLSDWKFTMQETVIPPHTVIFLYTDGLTEADNGQHELFSLSRIQEQAEIVAANNCKPEEIIAQMTKAVKEFANGADQSDDLTMLAVQYKREKLKDRYQDKITLDNNIEQIPQLSEFVDKACHSVGFDEKTTISMNLAIEEAVVNVMSYAYPKGTKGKVTIEAISNDERVKFVISDNGVPFDPTVVAEADTTLPAEERNIGGLGVFLIRHLMDSVNYERIGGFNVLTLRKKLNKLYCLE